jgi:hypothetical protein
MVFTYLGKALRLRTLQLLFTVVAMLSGTTLNAEATEDTAVLSEDRKSLSLSFVLHGTRHSIDLPYNPYRIESSEIKVYDEEGNFVDSHYTTCPGLQDFLFHQVVLDYIYEGNVGRVVIEDLTY